MCRSLAIAVTVSLLLVPGIAQPQSVPVPDAVAIEEACRQIRPWDRLRIQADFGTFEGSVKVATPSGLSGLRPRSEPGQADAIPELIAWDRIQRIERAGSTSAIGARRGAMVLGVVGASLGLLANSITSGFIGDTDGSTFLIGGVTGVAVGALLGATFGSIGTSWSSIYPR